MEKNKKDEGSVIKQKLDAIPLLVEGVAVKQPG